MRRIATTHLTLALLIAAGLGVSAPSLVAKVQSGAQRKPSAKGSTASSSGKKTSGAASGGGSTHSTAKSGKKSKKATRRTKGQQAPTPDRITEIQQALAKDGSFTGEPNGKWDDATTDAMKKFQQAHGLTPTGKLDARTLQQLGLGSAISGVAPPLPPVSPSSLTSSSSPSNSTVPPQPPVNPKQD